MLPPPIVGFYLDAEIQKSEAAGPLMRLRRHLTGLARLATPPVRMATAALSDWGLPPLDYAGARAVMADPRGPYAEVSLEQGAAGSSGRRPAGSDQRVVRLCAFS